MSAHYRGRTLTDAGARANVHHSLAGKRDLLALEEADQQERAVPHLAGNLADLFFEQYVLSLDGEQAVLVGVGHVLVGALRGVSSEGEWSGQHGDDVVSEWSEHREGNVVRLARRAVLAGHECDLKTRAASCVDLRSD